MGRSFEKHSIEQIEMARMSLARAEANFATAVTQMQSAKMKDAWIEWSRKHGESLALLAEAGRAAVTMIEGQVVSHLRGEPSSYERLKQKTGKYTERARQKRAAEHATAKTPPKRPGRPKKTK